MPESRRRRTLCWRSCWNPRDEAGGLEHLQLGEREADSVVLGFDDAGQGPFRLIYRLAWDDGWRLRRAELAVTTAHGGGTLTLEADGEGRWLRGDGQAIDELAGCRDIDIWPTPFTNTFPMRRAPLAIGERREFLMAWVDALKLTFRATPQAYTRLADRRYRFESLDGSGFRAELAVDDEGIVVDYPGFFRQVEVEG